MRVNPTAIFKCESNAERKVFSLFEQVEFGETPICYHSLNCSKHEYKRWAEIDFLFLSEKFAIVLEVKGGRVSETNGLWTFTNRFDDTTTSNEGPFAQASSAMYSLQRLLVDRYKLPVGQAGNLIFGFGVVFPDIDWNEDTVEMPRVLAADRNQCRNAQSFKRFLEGVQSYWRSKNPKNQGLDGDIYRAVKSKIRPDIDLYPPYSTRIGQATDSFQTLTAEQFVVADVIDANEQVIVSGGAGTGKTYLLVQSVRIASAKGANCLIIVHSKVLATLIRILLDGVQCTVTTVEKLDRLNETFDILFVDEGQDLLNFPNLDLISQKLNGGLDQGVWRWFMDKNNQSSILGAFDQEAHEFMKNNLECGPPVNIPLKKNVRNTIEVARRVQLWTGADIGKAQLSGHGGTPKLHVVDAAVDEAELVSLALDELISKGVDKCDIGIILSSSCDHSLLQKFPVNLRESLVRLDTTTIKSALRDRIVYGNVQDFKGLERPIIIAVGFRGSVYLSDKKAELYVALTRANFAFHLFADRELGELLRSNAASNQKMVTQ